MDEIARRTGKIDQIDRAWLKDSTFHSEWEGKLSRREERKPEALKLLVELQRTGDTDSFRKGLESWTHRPGYDAFSGFGLMFIHQLVNYSDEPSEVAGLLANALIEPDGPDDAADKIRRLVAYVDRVKRGAHPAPKRVPFVASLFWSLANNHDWPCFWNSAEQVLTNLGWLSPVGDLDRLYLEYRDIVLSFGRPAVDIERLLWWVNETKPFTGLDPSLVERCDESIRLAQVRQANAGEYPTADDAEQALLNARCILGDLNLAGEALSEQVSAALGRQVAIRRANLEFAKGGPYRTDGYVVWMVAGSRQHPSIRLWVTKDGVAIGLHPGWGDKGYTERVGAVLAGNVPGDLEFLRVRDDIGNRIEPAGADPGGAQFLIGRWFPGAQALDNPGLADEIVRISADLQPAMDRIMRFVRGEPEQPGDDPLLLLVNEFRRTRPYPNDRDEANAADRERFAEGLSRDGLRAFDVDAFRQIINTGRYGGPGAMSILNSSLRAAENADPQRLDEFARSLDYLLWNQSEPDDRRINRLLDPGDLGMRGLGESVIMKLLAITHPARYIPAFPYSGAKGKRALMALVGLPDIEEGDQSRGELQVESNDVLRERLEPHLPGDSWGKAQFLYWLTARGQELEPGPDLDPIGDLAEELLLPREFLDEIVELLHDKGQLVFYGPPGTGKTYVAKKLAEALAPNPGRRLIVQFHPSTSYEDFFEGYRPDTFEDQMVYRLVKGPLSRMADQATDALGIDHVMVIDEINRANLPKVLGELLFLLEYRDESVRTLYRPDDTFELPENLYFIGTMNTADRSIALVDAALRRRFHFVPFFPNEDPIDGLLRRWLEREHGPMWVANLVDQVNAELFERIGPHLQLGPSYFMVPGLDEAKLRRIWSYDVFPFIEEQLFGELATIEQYRYDEVRARFGAQGASLIQPEAGEVLDEASTNDPARNE